MSSIPGIYGAYLVIEGKSFQEYICFANQPQEGNSFSYRDLSYKITRVDHRPLSLESVLEGQGPETFIHAKFLHQA